MLQNRDRLNKFTEGCRDDMHEPDEQGITAIVAGDHLDNAFGDNPNEVGEYVVVLKREFSNGHIGVECFNLANLIALARKASL